MPRITDLALEDRAVDEDGPVLGPLLRQLYPRLRPAFPLCEQILRFRVQDVDSAVSNSLQRVMTQELPGCYMTADVGAMAGSTDPFMVPEFVLFNRLALVPLAYGTDVRSLDGLVLGLDVTNRGEALKTVYSGDLAAVEGSLSRPIFNPTHELATLQPGKRIVISRITFAEGLGRAAAPANVSTCGASVPEMARLPREQTHLGLQGAAQLSGYVESSATARPRAFRVSTVVVAAHRGSTSALQLPARACRNILMRLRQALEVISAASQAGDDPSVRAGATSDVSSWSVSEADGVATAMLTLRGETYTVAEVLRGELHNLGPELGYAGVERGADAMSLSVKATRAGDPADLQGLYVSALKSLMATYTALLAYDA